MPVNPVDEMVGEIISDSDGHCMIQVMTVDEEGKALVSCWIVPESFVDVTDKITELFPTVPLANAELNIAAAIPGMVGLMTDADTHVQWGGENES